MRSGVTATESGNTYEQIVPAWRLIEFIVNSVPRDAPPQCIRTMAAETRRPAHDRADVHHGRNPKTIRALRYCDHGER